jgi:hypothetical protein
MYLARSFPFTNLQASPFYQVMSPSTLPRLQNACKELASVDPYDSGITTVRRICYGLQSMRSQPTSDRYSDRKTRLNATRSNAGTILLSNRCGYHYKMTGIAWSEDSIETLAPYYYYRFDGKDAVNQHARE